MKGLADDMASAGKKIEDEELISYILTGLGDDYESIVTFVSVRAEPISVQELYTQLVAHEQRIEMRNNGGHQSSAIVAYKGGRGGGNRSVRGCGGGGRNGNVNDGGRGGRGGFWRGGGRGHGPSWQQGVFCQVCGKEGHDAIRCFKRFDHNYKGPHQKSVSAATTNSYGVDTNWYVDFGATDHITGELERLTVRDKYNGTEQVHVVNGSGMEINHIGHSVLHSPTGKIHLKNILHVPQASKNLVSVNRLSRNNNVFIEFHPNHFSIKEQQTKKTLLQGKCEKGLYPLKSLNKQALGATREALGVIAASSSLWHARLGHPSAQVVQQVASRHKISLSRDLNNHVCNACQQGKCHQLPYTHSSVISSSPMDLVFSDVWGPAPTSVGRHDFYVSFINDHTKFVWIHLLRHKSDVFKCFQEFQQLVERQFNKKIKSIQTDWGGEYQALNSFFKCVGIVHRVSCPHAHQQNGSVERRHRHIVEMGLTLLSHSSMPLKFWDEAFLTAVFLINRLPSKVINNETPYERLYGHPPDYSFLRTFGCAVWPHQDPTMNTNSNSDQNVCLSWLQ